MAALATIAVLAAAGVARAAPRPPTVRLANGLEFPLISAGTFEYNDTQAESSVRNALAAGFVGVDTALGYGNQRGVGRAVATVPRGSVFLMTKVPGCGVDKSVRAFSCYNDTAAALEENLRQLGTSYVDMVIIHFPPLPSFLLRTCAGPSCDMVQNQWKAMEEFYRAGKARGIGVSNYCPSCFECLFKSATVKPLINQVLYNVGFGYHYYGFKSYAEAHGAQMVAYSPLGSNLAGGLLHRELMKDPQVLAVAKNHNRSVVNVALKFITDQGIPTVTKSASLKHLEDDLDLWSYELTQEEKDLLGNKSKAWPVPVSFACNSQGDVMHI